MTKDQINRVALMANDGYARSIYPAHTSGDGDTIFSLATGKWAGEANVNTVGALAADAMAEAVVRAVKEATGAGGVPAVRDLKKQ